MLSRPLDLNELLDWSTYTPGQGNIGGVPGACTQFEENASPDSHNNPLNNATCYPIKNGQANVSFSSFELCGAYLLMLILFSASTCGRVVHDFGIFDLSIELLVYCGVFQEPGYQLG